MARRSAIVRFSNALWLGPLGEGFRDPWLRLLQRHEWEGLSDVEVARLVLQLAGRVEFKHLPPFRPARPQRMQGNGNPFQLVSTTTDGRATTTQFMARGRPFHVLGLPPGVHATGRISAQLLPTTYLIIGLEFRINAPPDWISSEALWACVESISPNTYKSEVQFAKPGLKASPRTFALALLKATSHSLLRPGRDAFEAEERWLTGVMAVDGAAPAPASIVGRPKAEEELGRKRKVLDEFGAGQPLQLGDRGYYYVEPPSTLHRNIRRRFATLSAIQDFARYHRDGLMYAAEEAKQLSQALSNEILLGERRTDLTAAGLRARALNEFAAALDGATSAIGGGSRRWQRQVYSVFAQELGVRKQHEAFKEKARELSDAIGKLRGQAAFESVRAGTQRGYDVFISYARAEIERVRPIKVRLEALQLDVFLDEAVIQVGDRWLSVVNGALVSSKVVIGCCSRQSLARDMVIEELSAAFERRKLLCSCLEPIDDKTRDAFVFLSALQNNNALLDDAGKICDKQWRKLLVGVANQMEKWASLNADSAQADVALMKARAVRAAAAA